MSRPDVDTSIKTVNIDNVKQKFAERYTICDTFEELSVL